MPLVESKYRVKPGRENRAIAGLSMGGGQTIAIGFRHLDLFSSIGAFSAAIPGDFEKEFAQTIANPKDVNAKLKVFWFACGKQDSLFERSQKFSALLDAHQIKHTFRPSEGAHVYKVWRLYLSEFAPMLFH
jgi:enterochelin esterase family protein